MRATMTFDTRTLVDAPTTATSRLTALAVGALIAVITASGTNAGIQGSGFRMASIGTLDTRVGFTVNGVSYDVSHARVTVDGVVTDPSVLKSGHVITVESTVSADGSTATADEISLVNNVRGAVTEVDAAAGTVTSAGPDRSRSRRSNPRLAHAGH